MAKKLTSKKPLVGNIRPNCLKATKMRQKPNLQTKRVNGVKVTLAASEWKSLEKATCTCCDTKEAA